MPRSGIKDALRSISKHRRGRFAAVAAATCITAASIATRKWRDDKLTTLQRASTSGSFYVGNTTSMGNTRTYYENTKSGKVKNGGNGAPQKIVNDVKCKKRQMKRDLRLLNTNLTRAALMGKARSVKDELEVIRQWHRENGYFGGLVLRELNQPLYRGAYGSETGSLSDAIMEGGDDVETIPIHDLNQRECYYLYYEVRGNAEVKQQIFCRGTTIRADIATGLKSIYVYDEELGCNIHLGFREHANRLLEDVEPLLISPSDRRSTVELSGHSLGGAVSLIVAMKLRKRGYNVVRVTTFGAPKICDADAVPVLAPLLPPDTLRVENDLDGVVYLPPHGSHLGDKLWFVTKEGRKEGLAIYLPFIDRSNHMWVESSLINCRIPETIANMPSAHRMRSYSNNINKLISDIEERRQETVIDNEFDTPSCRS